MCTLMQRCVYRYTQAHVSTGAHVHMEVDVSIDPPMSLFGGFQSQGLCMSPPPDNSHFRGKRTHLHLQKGPL